MARKKSYAQRRLENIKRSKRRIKAAINKLPEAPLGSGLGGQAWNLLRRNPDAFVDASSVAFNQETLMRVVVAQEEVIRALESQTGKNPLPPRQSVPGTILNELQQSTPNPKDVEAILQGISDEDLLDDDVVDEIIGGIQTGREVIRRSNQFSRQNIVDWSKLNAPARKPRSASAKRSDKKLSKAFKEANSRLRKKNGQLKKGKTQSDVAKLAHRLRKKMK